MGKIGENLEWGEWREDGEREPKKPERKALASWSSFSFIDETAVF
jgi:hypothetical protein